MKHHAKKEEPKIDRKKKKEILKCKKILKKNKAV
jgi:hypothetical protein